jgi:hypothetical protein
MVDQKPLNVQFRGKVTEQLRARTTSTKQAPGPTVERTTSAFCCWKGGQGWKAVSYLLARGDWLGCISWHRDLQTLGQAGGGAFQGASTISTCSPCPNPV